MTDAANVRSLECVSNSCTGVGGMALNCILPGGVYGALNVKGYEICTATCGIFILPFGDRLGRASPRGGNSSAFPLCGSCLVKLGLSFWPVVRGGSV